MRTERSRRKLEHKTRKTMAKYRNIELEIAKTSSYGRYLIIAENYHGKRVTAHTTEAEAYDFLNDDSNKAKHQWAKHHCYTKIKRAYEVSK